MLQKIYIKNYAIIEELEILFHPQFTVITGETGAGKSIILGALSLILGERADTSILIDKDQKCIIEAAFLVDSNLEVEEFLRNEELDYEPVTKIRREINSSGKSRAFINDTPVNLGQLQVLGNILVDLNRQFDNRLLFQSNYQFEILDSFTNNSEILPIFQQKLSLYNVKCNLIAGKIDAAEKADKDQSYWQFLFNELEEANFQSDEIENLEEKIKSIQHQEDIIKSINGAQYILSADEENIISQQRKILSDLQFVSKYNPTINQICDRINSTLEELKDISYELDNLLHNINFDNDELQIWTERLDLGFKLMKKHHVNTTNELLAIKNELQQNLSAVHNLSEEISKLESEIIILEEELEGLAQNINDNRLNVIPNIIASISEILNKIGMSNASLKINLIPTERFNKYGKTEIEFLLDANKSGQFLPISKVASGGELSRLLLAIKSIVSGNMARPTLIFDEVDAAISGEAAKQVSILMEQLSNNHQVIVLTHQAQMAAKGHQHLFIYKKLNEQSNRMQTQFLNLSYPQRVKAIAQMLDGDHPSEQAILTANTLLAHLAIKE